MTHLRIWKFRPPQDCDEEFAFAYGADGVWASLFRKAPGYLGTQLVRPADAGGWWLTIDRWDSALAFEMFGRNFGELYRELDSELEGVAGEEEFVGAFEEAE